MLPTYVSSCDSADEPRFIDEIEIGATTISTQYGNFPIKMEYSSNDEGSLEHELLTEDQNTSHHATTREADSLSLTCEYCQESFDNIRQLNNHRRNHQLETCPICTETLIARYLKEHMARSHSKSVALPQKRIYKCDQCDKLFPAKTLLIDHQRNHQTKECPFCKQMVKQRALNMHIARKHPTSVSKQETGTFMCDLCDKSFVSKPLLAEHQRDHLTKHCPECGVELLARCLKKHMARKHSPSGLSGKVSRSYQCDRCDKTFSQKRSLVCHQAKHQSAVEGNVS
uniref:C2H2-type domain-containing protein n=1 Tax=Anopheles epiroticus TaxID=199890 RepID=A0A182PJZ9_9DIPT